MVDGFSLQKPEIHVILILNLVFGRIGEGVLTGIRLPPAWPEAALEDEG